jgi:ATP-binding cassette subfamily F protein 3
VGYGAGKPVLSRIDLRIDPDDRIALLGRNGNGKTTLARLLSGQLPLMAGGMAASGKLRVGYFAQHHVEELEAEATPIQHMSRLLATAKPGAVRAQLARFGFSGDKAEVKVVHLSGGERAKLALALITRDAPHMLILDEPTNHLDVDARTALVEALNEYSGAVMIVSHDRHLLELIADRLVLVADGTVTEFSGSLDDYRGMVMGQREKDGDAGGAARNSGRKDERRSAVQTRERSQPLRKAVEQAEREIARLTAQRAEIDRALADPASYRGSKSDAAVVELTKTRAEIDRALAGAEARWLAASEAFDRAAPAPQALSRP